MKRGLRHIPNLWLSIFLVAGISSVMSGQNEHRLTNIHFYQLSTAEGLSDNYIYSMTVDRSGYLWVGTGEGLCKFNGKTVDKYFKSDYPVMISDYVAELVCDDQNRIWMRSGDGYITIIDEHRRFHAVRLMDSQARVKVRMIMNTQAHGPLLLTRSHHLRLKENVDLTKIDTIRSTDFDTVQVSNIDPVYEHSFYKVRKAGANRYYFAGPSNVYPVDYETNTGLERFACPKCHALCQWENNTVLFFENDNKVIKARNLETREETFPFEGIVDQFQKPISRNIKEGHRINDDYYIFTTSDAGMYVYTPSTKKLYNYPHNSADPTTLVNNMPNIVTHDSTGWIFVSATPHGVSYYNRKAVVGQQVYFEDDRANKYDGWVSRVNSLDNNTFYLGTAHAMIEWNRTTNTSIFHTFSDLDRPDPVINDYICDTQFDDFGRMWLFAKNIGIYVIDTTTGKQLQFISLNEKKGDLFRVGNPMVLQKSPDGKIWATGTRGFVWIDPITFKVTPAINTPLKELENYYCYQVIFKDSIAHIMTSQKGVVKYNLATEEITKLDTSNGLMNNNANCLNWDRNGNLYVGTIQGMQVFLSDGTSLKYTTDNGLLNMRVEALLLDKKNRMWIGNDVGIGCFSIADTSLRAFDERYGLSIAGFRLVGAHQGDNDELFWGTERGFQYFFPDDLYGQQVNLRTIVNQIETRDIANYLTRNDTFQLAPGDNFVTFHFSTIEFSKQLHTFYQYKLEGLDPDWINVADQNSARYTLLKPGVYKFKVRASNDKKTWFDAENEVMIELRAQFYEKAWFRILAVLGFLALGYLIISRISKKQKQRTEAIETESVVNYFASQINKHQHHDDLLWDVAQNCISRLNLEECVIYMTDHERQVLVQKAAFGPKNTTENTIFQPIEIPFGQGITGSVVINKKPEIVNNTDKDSRYIVDDERRLSEIAVPIIVDGSVIGVIDSEHSQRNFFTQKHLSLMTTIAILTANQIQRIQAEEEKQQAEIEVLQNKQKATESRLQSLRLQMNPHFLFNALNSIQQMILANEEMVATKYLSRFSKLLRSILIHSDKEMITLKEELDILKLYVELESVRFKEAFSYEIHCDVDIDAEEVKIPTLLVQPFVENAIWHGLMHKEGDRHLKIEFKEQGDIIHCIVEDNGIGRQKAREMRISTGQDKKHTSKGIEVSTERLKSMQKNGGQPGSLLIHDLVDAQGNPTGTRIEIILPIQN